MLCIPCHFNVLKTPFQQNKSSNGAHKHMLKTHELIHKNKKERKKEPTLSIYHKKKYKYKQIGHTT